LKIGGFSMSRLRYPHFLSQFLRAVGTLAVLGLIALAVPTAASAVGPSGTIKGRITAKGGVPLSDAGALGVLVSVYSAPDEVVATATSLGGPDHNQYVVDQNLVQGVSYRVLLEAPGYAAEWYSTSTAVNALSYADASPVTPDAEGISESLAPMVIPSPPRDVTATQIRGDGAVEIHWKPSLDGPATSYLVTNSADSQTCTPSVAPYKCTIDGFEPDTTVNFTVRAYNDAGTSDPSTPTIDLTTVEAPSKPVGVVATAGIVEASVEWAAPLGPLNVAVAQYKVTAVPGGAICLSNTRSCTFTGLTPGDPYSFEVRAKNAAGWGAKETSNIVAALPKLSQRVSGKVRTKIKRGHRATLPKLSSGQVRLVWKSATPRVCTVKAGKVIGKRKGKCRLTVVAVETSTLLVLRSIVTLKIVR
jgi:hypothetical protein